MGRVKSIIDKTCVLLLVLIIAAVFSVQSVYSGSDQDDGIKHIGNYYFKYNYSNDHVYISKYKNRGYKKTPVDSMRFGSNGKQIVYVDQKNEKFYIKTYDIKSKKTKILKKLPDKGYWYVAAISGGYIWLGDLPGLYRFTIKTGKLKLIKKNVTLVNRISDSYYLIRFGTDKFERTVDVGDSTEYIFSSKWSLYHITKDGKLKLRKSLGTIYGWEADDYGNAKYLYYAKNNAHDLYRVKPNGKNNKRIYSSKGSIITVYKNRCVLVKNGVEYKYYYKSKKLKKTS